MRYDGLPQSKFYDDSILPGTKTFLGLEDHVILFYDDSILPGTKTLQR